MKLSPPHHSGPVTNAQGSIPLWGFWCLVLLALRPLDSPDLWWTLARGRAAMSGPAAADSIILFPGAAAAHWADGLPWFVIHSIGDFLLLQWTPLLSGLLLFWQLGVFTSGRVTVARLFLPCLLLILLRPALQPSPLLNAAVCLLLLDATLRIRASRILLCGSIGLTMVLWANTAVLPLWGLFWLLSHPPRLQPARSRAAQLPPARSLLLPAGVVAILAVCLNPRGPLVFVDDLRSLTAVVHPVWRGWLSATAADGPLTGMTQAATVAPPLLVGLLCLVPASGLLQRGRLQPDLVITLLLIPAAIFNPEHLPLCALSIVLQGRAVGNPQSVQQAVDAPAPTAFPKFSGFAIATLLSGCMLADAGGAGPFAQSRIGWGLAQTLDSRLLDLPTVSSALRPVIWAADRRTAGLAAWRSDAVQLVDHPLTAFQQGRLAEHLQLIQDLRSGRRAAFRLADGTAGGWHRKLQRWQVSMLMTSVESFSLNAALQRSTWKLADLDSPNMPWLTSESPSSAALIQDLAAQQNFVQWGSWRPDAAVYDPLGVRVDLCEMAGLGVDPLPALRQAALFRSQRLPLAAIRSLGPVRTQPNWFFPQTQQVLAAVHDCERDLAEMEWDNYGVPGLWRRMFLQQLSEHLQQRAVVFPWDAELQPGTQPATQQSSSEWKAIVTACIAGDLQQALTMTNPGPPETQSERHYASAMLLLELGDVPQAREELKQLLNGASAATTSATVPSHALQLAARGWLELTGGLEGPQP